ncbi:hypothetical protein B0H16DRAFT_1705447 [Mycena metata]|uniref:Uncharacterized protein n=1 Tax=Mycena metata TaxID=1033252 RepID=A0AAD7DWB3_9AGAR|nr:hypothetical protein B0H16DRAFT_1705447 [Mycena metata]
MSHPLEGEPQLRPHQVSMIKWNVAKTPTGLVWLTLFAFNRRDGDEVLACMLPELGASKEKARGYGDAPLRTPMSCMIESLLGAQKSGRVTEGGKEEGRRKPAHQRRRDRWGEGGKGMLHEIDKPTEVVRATAAPGERQPTIGGKQRGGWSRSHIEKVLAAPKTPFRAFVVQSNWLALRGAVLCSKKRNRVAGAAGDGSYIRP